MSVPGKQLDHVVGVLKAYSTCVGAGPFTAEKAMPESWMELLRKFGGEYGAATGRPRRVGPFDAVASRYKHEMLTWLHGIMELEVVNQGYNSSYIEIPSKIRAFSNRQENVMFL